MDDEIWKSVPGYEGLYEVSNLGNVRSSKNRKARKKNINQKGYYCVGFYKDKKQTSQRVHRLVAVAFLGAGKEDHVNHKNMNKLDNRLENLELVSVRENTSHGLNKHLIGGSYDKKKKFWVGRIRYKGEKIYLGCFPTLEQAHDAYMKKAAELGIKNKYASRAQLAAQEESHE